MKLLKLLALSTTLAALAACFGNAELRAQSPRQAPAQSKDAPPIQQIKIDNFSFSPQQLTVPIGTTITWTNNDDIPHTVVGAHQEFRSKGLDTNDQFSFTFTKAGSFEYFCSVHPMMTGKIVVH